MTNYYAAADSILDQCDASDHPNKNEVKGGKRTWHVCTSCWNKHVEARQAARKQELADARAERKRQESEAQAAAATRWAVDGGRMVKVVEYHGNGFAIYLGNRAATGNPVYKASGGWMLNGTATWKTYEAAKEYAEQNGAIVVQ